MPSLLQPTSPTVKTLFTLGLSIFFEGGVVATDLPQPCIGIFGDCSIGDSVVVVIMDPEYIKFLYYECFLPIWPTFFVAMPGIRVEQFFAIVIVVVALVKLTLAWQVFGVTEQAHRARAVEKVCCCVWGALGCCLVENPDGNSSDLGGFLVGAAGRRMRGRGGGR